MSLQQQPISPPPPEAAGGYPTHYASHRGRGSIGPVIGVLAVIAVLGIIAGLVGRLCSGRRVFGLRQYDVEGWIERKCASCIDGRIDHTQPTPAAACSRQPSVVAGDEGSASVASPES
ncbi:hypothetical protein AXF42_Ash018205 [Apostasia shenzhenica]|uniref:Uncharacterized protein n=1 Tax=Apostasia shenzhenica TaxID=1088818 RepID=A0A2I0B1C8_9ASPA|nr:hypothetical protein AXF42_Ash018205 [Apostasia shenzhenica]